MKTTISNSYKCFFNKNIKPKTKKVLLKSFKNNDYNAILYFIKIQKDKHLYAKRIKFAKNMNQIFDYRKLPIILKAIALSNIKKAMRHQYRVFLK